MYEVGTKIIFSRDSQDVNEVPFKKGEIGFIIEEHPEGFFRVNYDGKELEGLVKDDFTSFASNIHDAINAKLDADESSKAFKDSENRIIHAKKYKAAYSKINLRTISEIEKNEGLAETLVTKEKVYEKLDVEAQQTGGVSSATAWLKAKLREVFPQKPNLNTADARKVYLYYVQYILSNIIPPSKVRAGDDFYKSIEQMHMDTIKLFMVALDETGMLEDRLISEEESIKDEIFTVSQKIVEDTKDLAALESELIEKFGEDAIRQDYKIDNIYNIQLRPNPKYISGTDYEAKYSINSDQIIDGMKQLKFLTKDALPPTIQKWVIEEWHKKATHTTKNENEIISRSSSKYANLARYLLDDVFGEKFRKYLLSNGHYATKSQKSSFYNQAEEFLPQSASTAEYAEKQLALLKQRLINLTKYKIIFERKDLVELSNEIKEAIRYNQLPYDQKPSDHPLRDLQFTGTAYFHKYFSGKPVFLALSPKDYGQSKKQIIKEPENHDEFTVYANKSLQKIDNQIKETEAEIKRAEAQATKSTEDEDWSWSGKKKGNPTGQKVDIRINSQTPLSHIERTNALKINEFSSNDEIQTFYKNVLGIDRLTYGKYLPDDERRTHAYHFAMAIVDYCEVLNWNIKDFTKQLDLGMAFAAAGSGSASAFYASTPAAFINLTRRRGDGSLSHEFTHYVDNFIANRADRHRWGSDWNIGTQTSRYTKRASTTTSRDINDQLYYFFAMVKFGHKPSYMPIDLLTQFDLWKVEGLKSIEERGIKPKSKSGLIWYRTSSALSGYWTRHWELLARASECYIFDKLSEREMFNNYLVSGEYFDSYHGVYPSGPERKMCNYILDKLYAAIKQHFNIGDFSFETTDRIDNFIAFNEDDTNTEDSDEKIEFETEQEYKVKTAMTKIDEFIAMIEKYRDGGAINSLSKYVNDHGR